MRQSVIHTTLWTVDESLWINFSAIFHQHPTKNYPQPPCGQKFPRHSWEKTMFPQNPHLYYYD